MEREEWKYYKIKIRTAEKHGEGECRKRKKVKGRAQSGNSVKGGKIGRQERRNINEWRGNPTPKKNKARGNTILGPVGKVEGSKNVGKIITENSGKNSVRRVPAIGRGRGR